MKPKTKALSLISGGLDSLLATKVILEQDIHVEGVNFFTGFTGDLPDNIPSINKNSEHKFSATNIAKTLDIKLHVVNVVEEFKPILIKPKHGYGANLNPCLDCKIFMVNQALRLMHEWQFDFIITGEVLGQRNKSQRKATLPIVAANAEERLLRPLCAKLLPETLPEREHLVNRDLLCNFCGRGRKPQIALAKKFGIKEFPQPAGGCALTDPNFAKRLHDLWRYRPTKNYSLDDINLLKIARHLRIAPNFKIIAGRDEADNKILEIYQENFISLQNQSTPGSLLLIDGIVNADEINFAARLAAYFSKSRTNIKDDSIILIKHPKAAPQTLLVKPISSEDFNKNWYV